MSTEVNIPKLDWFERYKRLIDAAWGVLLADEDFVYRRWGKEALSEFFKQTRPKWSGVVAKRLIEKLSLKPDVEGAIKLLGVYSQEVWGFGDPRYFEVRLESPTSGTFTILACRGWEKMPEHCKKINCGIACHAECSGVISALSPDLKLTIVQARPRGDDHCKYTIEL